jgi:hypothetical protein
LKSFKIGFNQVEPRGIRGGPIDMDTPPDSRREHGSIAATPADLPLIGVVEEMDGSWSIIIIEIYVLGHWSAK